MTDDIAAYRFSGISGTSYPYFDTLNLMSYPADIPAKDVIDAICDAVADGDSRRKACAKNGVDEGNFRRWCRQNEPMMTQYTRACEERAHTWAEEFMEVADDGSNDWMESNDPENPGWRENGEAIRRSALRIDARKWMMARILPKQFGDKQQHEHSGKITLESLVTGTHEPTERS